MAQTDSPVRWNKFVWNGVIYGFALAAAFAIAAYNNPPQLADVPAVELPELESRLAETSFR